MSTLYGLNYDRAYNKNRMMGVGEYNGHKKVMYDELTFAAEAANNDILKVGKLPKGARVLSCTVKSPDLGGTGTLNIGTPSNGVEAADADGFVVGADASGQAVQASGNGANIGVKFSAETDIEVTFVGATASATGKKLQVWTEYIVD